MIAIPDHAVSGSALREEIANQQRHIDSLEAALMPLAELPVSANYDGPLPGGIPRHAVTAARHVLGIHYGLVTDEATAAMTIPAWQRWLANAKPAAPGRPASICLYYSGYLAGSMYVPRSHGAGRPADIEVKKPRVAEAAWEASEDGLVHLVQVKVAPSDYRYYAIRANPAAVAEVTTKRKANR